MDRPWVIGHSVFESSGHARHLDVGLEEWVLPRIVQQGVGLRDVQAHQEPPFPERIGPFRRKFEEKESPEWAEGSGWEAGPGFPEDPSARLDWMSSVGLTGALFLGGAAKDRGHQQDTGRYANPHPQSGKHPIRATQKRQHISPRENQFKILKVLLEYKGSHNPLSKKGLSNRSPSLSGCLRGYLIGVALQALSSTTYNPGFQDKHFRYILISIRSKRKITDRILHFLSAR